MEDLNTLDTEEVPFDFLEEHYLFNLVNFTTCYKSVENPSSIDLIINNKHHIAFRMQFLFQLICLISLNWLPLQ